MLPPESDEIDLIEGVAAIARVLGLSKRRTGYLIENDALPIFRAYPGSRIVCARRSTLARWLAEREAAGRDGKADA